MAGFAGGGVMLAGVDCGVSRSIFGGPTGTSVVIASPSGCVAGSAVGGAELGSWATFPGNRFGKKPICMATNAPPPINNNSTAAIANMLREPEDLYDSRK